MFRDSGSIRWVILLMFLATNLALNLAWAQTTNSTSSKDTHESTITVQGTIQSVETSGVPMGTHLEVSIAGQTVNVYVGPKSFVGVDASAFHPGDTVQIQGHPVSRPTGTMLIAWQIQDGAQVYRLRDQHGLPLHNGRRGQ